MADIAKAWRTKEQIEQERAATEAVRPVTAEELAEMIAQAESLEALRAQVAQRLERAKLEEA